MKPMFNACVAAAFACMALPAAAETEKTTEVTRNPDGSVTKTVTKTKFDGDTRTKVVTYFDTYKSSRFGLPPEWVARVKVKEIPDGWRMTRIEPGVVIAEGHRTYLLDAPDDLVKVLPPADAGVRYYIAGSNVIAVNSNFEVVDSIQIPSIKFTVED